LRQALKMHLCVSEIIFDQLSSYSGCPTDRLLCGNYPMVRITVWLDTDLGQ